MAPPAGPEATCLQVSICVINYNYGRFLADAIDSALAQSHAAVEVIVVDDGSTDNSREVIASYGVRVIPVLKENGGQGSAFNAGFAASSGDVVFFLDADDMLIADIAAQVAAAAGSRPDFAKVQFRMEVVDESGRPNGAVIPARPGILPNGDLGTHVLRFRSYPWPPSSANAYAARALARVLPIPEPTYPTYCDAYLAELMPLLGPIVSLDAIGARYRAHGRNGFLDLVLTAGWLRSKMALIAIGHENVRRLAADIGLAGVRQRSTDVLDVAHLGYRLASLRLDAANHPVPDDRVLTLVVRGIAAASRNPFLTPGSRIKRIGWFVAAGLAPGPLARRLVSAYVPDAPGRRLLRTTGAGAYSRPR